MDSLETIQKLQNVQNNIKIFTAVPMGVLMILYFFTYATLIDHGLTGFLFFEIVTSILFLMALIFLNPLSFALVKLMYGRRQPYQSILQQLSPSSIVKPADQLLQDLQLNDQNSNSN